MSKTDVTRRGVLRSGAVAGAGLALPTIFTASSASAFTNDPTGGSVTLGFNVPQTGPYADEGMDELRAFQLAVEHLNGGGDGGGGVAYVVEIAGRRPPGGVIVGRFRRRGQRF